jgi:hypothetical protein
VLSNLEWQEILPSAEYLSSISEEHYNTLLRSRFIPVIISELTMDFDETGEFYKNLEEYIFMDLAIQDMTNVIMCLEDQSYLISRIHDFKDFIIAEIY